MSSFQFIYAEETKQVCGFCNKTSTYSGWFNLCDRRCYYGICELLGVYNGDSSSEPDPRLVTYFSKGDPNHSFDNHKILEYIKNSAK